MRRRAFGSVGATIALGLLGLGAPAVAQNAAPPKPVSRTLADVAAAESVTSRARPEYDAAGIGAGGFRLYPTLGIQTAYDDNIYNTDTNKISDGLVRFVPRVVARSDWARHSLIVSTGGAFEKYFSRTTEDNNQYDVTADGIYDASSAIAFTGGGTLARRVEPRGTLGDVFVGVGGERIRYNLGSGRLGATTQFARLLLTASGTYSHYNYLPVRFNGQRLSQDYRDRNEATAMGRADYVVGPGVRVFVSGSYNNQDYKQPLANFNQDSDGIAILGGAAFGINELISGELGIGYLKQRYDQPNVDDIGGFSYNGRITWNPTPLMTVTGYAARTIQQSPLAAQAGILQDSVGAQVDYELLRNLILSADGSFVSNKYQGLGRSDRLVGINARARYLANRWLEAGLSVGHRFQTSSGNFGREYAGSSVQLDVTLKR